MSASSLHHDLPSLSGSSDGSAPPLKPPTHPKPSNVPHKRPHPQETSLAANFFAFSLLVFSLISFAICILIVTSVFITNTTMFGREITDLPEILEHEFQLFKRKILPAEWIPTMGKYGSQSVAFGKNIGMVDYLSLRVFSKEELEEYSGKIPGRPIFLSITGLVFDVSEGRKFYDSKGGYHFFAGKDATVSFMTGCFDDSCFEKQQVGWSAIPPEQRKTMKDWVASYHTKYKLVGRLRDVYEIYNSEDPGAKRFKYTTPVTQEEIQKRRNSNLDLRKLSGYAESLRTDEVQEASSKGEL